MVAQELPLYFGFPISLLASSYVYLLSNYILVWYFQVSSRQMQVKDYFNNLSLKNNNPLLQLLQGDLWISDICQHHWTADIYKLWSMGIKPLTTNVSVIKKPVNWFAK